MSQSSTSHHRAIAALFFFVAVAAHAQTPFNVTGVTDKNIGTAAVTVNVATEPGYTYATYLNATNVSSGGTYVVRDPDFYLLQAFRTNTSTLEVTNRFFRFIIRNPARGDTEDGLPSHTPLLAIPSSSNEFSGARLRLIAPANFPTGYEIPVVAWAVNDQNHAIRANGWLESPGQNSIFLRRGAGSGFLAANNPVGALNYAVNLKGIQTNKTINLESGTTWTPVSGVLSGNTVWPPNSRIQVQSGLTISAGSSLTIGAGTIVRLNPGIDITNNGLVTINGTIDEPVVLMPNSRAQPWGGFIMRAGTGVINAAGTIFTGSGANQDWFGANGNPGSHRDEQALFFVNNAQEITLTDCAAMYLAGQLGHSVNGGTYRFTRFLLHHATTAGEFTGASFEVTDSALIEIPDDSSNFVDGDNDALYLVSGTHGFTNTLFGWTKDDGVDSGGDGYGTIRYESCWFESTFHEGNSLSGLKNVYPRNCVYLDCGQGHEDGYGSPTGHVDRCLILAGKTGLRHGDNYTNMSSYSGLLLATNSIVLNNHRDILGYNWRPNGWTNAYGQMDIRGNWLTRSDTNFPDNAVWDPANDSWRLAAFSSAPLNIVGVGMALRSGQITFADLTNGIPIRLSTFCTNFVSVDYRIDTPDSVLANGTLQFVPGEIVKWVRITPAQARGLVRLQLSNPLNAEITAFQTAFVGAVASPPPIISRGSDWKYPNVAGALADSWKTTAFSDSAWQTGPTQLGFGDGDEARTITQFANQITYYFRKTFTVADPNAFTNLTMWILRDDGAVLYFNGTEVYRSSNLPQPPTVITPTTLAVPDQGDNFQETVTLSRNALVAGPNLAAIEMHQQSASSSDLSLNLELTGNPLPRLDLLRFGSDWLLVWSDASFSLEQATQITGPWTRLSTKSPAPLTLEAATRFYRLAK